MGGPNSTYPNLNNPKYPRCGAFQLTPLILSAAGHKITDPNGNLVNDYGVALGNLGSSPSPPIYTFYPTAPAAATQLPPGLVSFDEMPSPTPTTPPTTPVPSPPVIDPFDTYDTGKPNFFYGILLGPIPIHNHYIEAR